MIPIQYFTHQALCSWGWGCLGRAPFKIFTVRCSTCLLIAYKIIGEIKLVKEIIMYPKTQESGGGHGGPNYVTLGMFPKSISLSLRES